MKLTRFDFWDLAGILLVLAVSLWVYWGCLGSPFHFDDALFLQNHRMTTPGDPVALLKPIQVRQLTYLSFYWNYRLGGFNPATYHLVNLLLHLANVLLMYLFVRLLVVRAEDCSTNEALRFVPVVAAGIFALHPIQTEVVNYVYQRSTLLAALFTLASLCAFLWSQRARRPLPFFLLAGFFYVLAIAGKEPALILPLVLAAYLWAYAGDLRSLKKSLHDNRGLLWPLLTLLVSAGCWVLYNHYRFEQRTAGFAVQEIGPLRYLTSQVQVIVTYLRLLLWPTGLSIDHDFSPAPWNSPYALFCLALLIALLVSAFWLRRSSATASFLVLGFFIWLSPTSSIIPSTDLMFEHRLYLPMISASVMLALGTFLCSGFLVHSSRWRGLTALILAGIVLTGYSAAFRARTFVWGDNVRLWEDAVAKAPGKPRAHYNLGVSYLGLNPERARREFEKVVMLRPNDASSLYNLGWLAQTSARYDSARRHYRAALAVDPEHWQAHHNLGNLDVLEGNQAQAIGRFQEAIRLRGDYWPAYLSLASLQIQQRSFGAALATLQRLENLRPDLLEARYLTAYALIGVRRFAEAEEELRFVSTRDPDGLFRDRIEELRQSIISAR